MPRASHYSPQIERSLATVLYHESKAKKIPMTRMTNTLLKSALMKSPYWSLVPKASKAEFE